MKNPSYADADLSPDENLLVPAIIATAIQLSRPWARYPPHAYPTTTLPDDFLKHCGPLNMKSIGNSKNIGLHHTYDSNVRRHPQNAKFLPIPPRHFGSPSYLGNYYS